MRPPNHSTIATRMSPPAPHGQMRVACSLLKSALRSSQGKTLFLWRLTETSLPLTPPIASV
jgi:hypothetical protein